MKFTTAALTMTLIAMAPQAADAFSTQPSSSSSVKHFSSGFGLSKAQYRQTTSYAPRTTALKYKSDSTLEKEETVNGKNNDENSDTDVDRLKAMAAKYRAEAAALEAERAQERAEAVRKVFEKFDVNHDGAVTLEELKMGLEKQLKVNNLAEDQVRRVMNKFDKSGDGKLQVEEFVSVDIFKNALEEFSRNEKQVALDQRKVADMEKAAAKALEEQLALINEKEPTPTEKALSVLPYLLPLLDSAPYASFLVMDHPDNPLAQALAAAYYVYKSIPLGGFLVFLGLTTLSGNLQINRLIRYNMLQAVYMDIALFFPGIVGTLVGFAATAANQDIPDAAIAATSNALFGTTLVMVAYAVASSLLGKEPNKIPFISNIAEQRTPTAEMFKDFFKGGNSPFFFDGENSKGGQDKKSDDSENNHDNNKKL